MVRDLHRQVAQTHAAIEGRRAEPDGSSFLPAIQNLPEPHVLAAIGAFAIGLFESEIFRPALIKKFAYRGIPVRPVEDDTTHNRKNLIAM